MPTIRDATPQEELAFERRADVAAIRKLILDAKSQGIPEEQYWEEIGSIIQKSRPSLTVEDIGSMLNEAEGLKSESDLPAETPVDLLECHDLPGIYVDPWGIPHIDGRRLPLEIRFHRKPGRKKATLIQRYRLTTDGERRAYYPKYFVIARAIAELHRDSPKPAIEKTCERCGNVFRPKTQKGKFCGDRCRKQASRVTIQ